MFLSLYVYCDEWPRDSRPALVFGQSLRPNRDRILAVRLIAKRVTSYRVRIQELDSPICPGCGHGPMFESPPTCARTSGLW